MWQTLWEQSIKIIMIQRIMIKLITFMFMYRNYEIQERVLILSEDKLTGKY